MSVRTLVKSIQNLMRQDTGVDGDAQRISQLCWMFFLVLPPLSVGEMTLRLYAALNYSQNSAHDLRRTVNGA